MTDPRQAYEIARAVTDANVRRDVRYTIPTDKLDRPTPFLSTFGGLGIQPKAIAADYYQPDRFAIASYFGPAVKFVRLVLGEDGYELVPDGGIGRSVQPSGQKLRLFPELLDDGSDGKRIASLAFLIHTTRGRNELLVGREGETLGLWRLVQTGYREWHTLPTMLMLHSAKETAYIEGITVVGETLYVLRSWQDRSPSWLEVYDLEGQPQPELPEAMLPPMSPHIQGIAVHEASKRIYYSTGSWDGLEVPPGIYCGRELVVPHICADGLAFAPDGALLATQYNDGLGNLGSPGMIWRIPAETLGR